MPRFYFDVQEGDSLTCDDQGLELESLDAAEYEAARGAADIGRDRLPKSDAREVIVEVKDENGFLLLTVTVAMTVRRTARAPVRKRSANFEDPFRTARDLGCRLDIDPDVESWTCLPTLLAYGTGMHVPDFAVVRFAMPSPDWVSDGLESALGHALPLTATASTSAHRG